MENKKPAAAQPAAGATIAQDAKKSAFAPTLHEILRLKKARNRRKISITDFDFMPAGYGHYKVAYTSPVTGKKWTTKTSDMPLIDATRNEENPKISDLELLKSVVKRGGF